MCHSGREIFNSSLWIHVYHLNLIILFSLFFQFVADIPFTKLNNETLKNWLEKLSRQTLYSASTYRNKYTRKIALETKTAVRNLIADSYIWVSLDATTDGTGRQVLAFIVGTLTNERLGPFLIHAEEVNETKDANAVKDFFERSLQELYLDGK